MQASPQIYVPSGLIPRVWQRGYPACPRLKEPFLNEVVHFLPSVINCVHVHVRKNRLIRRQQMVWMDKVWHLFINCGRENLWMTLRPKANWNPRLRWREVTNTDIVGVLQENMPENCPDTTAAVSKRKTCLNSREFSRFDLHHQRQTV